MMADQDMKDEGKKPSVNIGGDVNVTGGDLVAGDQNIEGDVVMGDKVFGNKVSIDSVKGNQVVVGDHASITVNPFAEMREAIEEMDIPAEQQAEVAEAVEHLEEMMDAESREDVDEDKLDQYLGVLEDIAPEAVELVINAVTNPGAAVGSGLRLAIQAWRKARKVARSGSDGGSKGAD